MAESRSRSPFKKEEVAPAPVVPPSEVKSALKEKSSGRAIEHFNKMMQDIIFDEKQQLGIRVEYELANLKKTVLPKDHKKLNAWIAKVKDEPEQVLEEMAEYFSKKCIRYRNGFFGVKRSPIDYINDHPGNCLSARGIGLILKEVANDNIFKPSLDLPLNGLMPIPKK